MDCIFCQIISGKLPAKFIYKDNRIAAFPDIQPKAPVHLLIVPVKHIANLNEAKEGDRQLLGDLLFGAKMIAEKLGIAKTGFKLILNNGKEAGQLVYHLHFHLLGGWNKQVKWKV